MSETGFRIFNSAFSIGAELIYAVLLTAFFKPFMSDQGRRWRKLLIVFSVYILFEIVCNRAALPQGSFGPILMVMLLAVSKWIDLEKSLVFLLTLLYLNARISSGSMVQSLYFIVERSLPFQLEPPEAVFSPRRPSGHAVPAVPYRYAGRHALCSPASNSETANDAPSAGTVLYQLSTNGGDSVWAGDFPAAGGVQGRCFAPAL